MHPWLKARLNSQQLSGTSHQHSCTEVFGDDIYTDEIFMAYYYAQYVGRLCQTARRYTQIPLYVNAAMNSGARALYAFGEHQALGFSPFAIDQASPAEMESVTKAYALLRQIHSLPAHDSYGLLFDQEDKERIINSEDMVITCRHYFTLPWDLRATDGSTWPEGGAILLKLANNEYLLAGTGVVVAFASAYEKAHEQQQVLGEDGFVASGSSTRQCLRFGFLGNQPLSTRFSCSKSSPIPQRADAPNTPTIADTTVFSINNAATMAVSPITRYTIQGRVPQ